MASEPELKTDVDMIKWASGALALIEQGSGILFDPIDMSALLLRRSRERMQSNAIECKRMHMD